MSTQSWEFDSKTIFNLIKTIEFTVKSTNPEAGACEVYVHVIIALSAMVADIARYAESPEKAAKEFGTALTANTIKMMEMANDE